MIEAPNPTFQDALAGDYSFLFMFRQLKPTAISQELASVLKIRKDCKNFPRGQLVCLNDEKSELRGHLGTSDSFVGRVGRPFFISSSTFSLTSA